MLQGRLLEARRASDTVFEATQLVNNDHTLLFAAATRCWLTSLQGQTSAALAAGQEAVEAALRVPDAQFSWMAHVCYGMALVEAGQHEEGRRRILVAGGPDLLDAPPASRPLWFRVLAEAELAAGRIDEAETAAEGAETIATRLNLPMRTGDASYARAATLIARGDHERALETARQAAASYEMAGVPLEAARSHMLAARALVLAGDIAAASEDLAAARTAFETCGAVGLADRATRELRRLGISVKRTPRRHAGAGSGPAALSTREREVAGLAAQGYTNRQIAEALFLSRKTVETHLAHIFAKLGVSSRGAMTTALREPSHH
jgi:DNA-binding CsgD family transcriptional regulator